MQSNTILRGIEIVLYHGTSGSRARQILADGVIQRTSVANRLHDFPKHMCTNGEGIDASTTLGYVYLTDLVLKAADYGVQAARMLSDDAVCIFRMELNASLLLPDHDEIKDTHSRYRSALPLNCTALDSLEHLGCAAFPRDIDLIQAAAAYTFIPTFLNAAIAKQEDDLLGNIASFGKMNASDLSALKENKCFYQDAIRYFANQAKWCNYTISLRP